MLTELGYYTFTDLKILFKWIKQKLSNIWRATQIDKFGQEIWFCHKINRNSDASMARLNCRFSSNCIIFARFSSLLPRRVSNYSTLNLEANELQSSAA